MLAIDSQKKLLCVALIFVWIQIVYVVSLFGAMVYVERWLPEIFSVKMDVPQFHNEIRSVFDFLSFYISILKTFDFIIVGGALSFSSIVLSLKLLKRVNISLAQISLFIGTLIISLLIFFYSI